MTDRGPVMYVVDYDIPADDPALRRRFYRALNKVCKEHGHAWDRSTLSVLITEDRDLARDVYELAVRHGRANLYEARLLHASHV